MDGSMQARRRRRTEARWLFFGVLLAALVAVAMNWSTLAGWLSPAEAGTAGNTLMASSPQDVAAARAMLSALAVGQRPGSLIGYKRSAFGDAWTDTDGNGCNQRDDVLLRDVLKDRAYRVGRQGGCDHDVLAGSWRDPYTGTVVTLTDAKAQGQLVQIDHIVPLSVAWRYGASAWTDATRLQFANDVEELLAVSASSNDDKGGSDASQWRPSLEAQCGYAARYVRVKSTYRLPTDHREKAALAAMLDTCG